MKILKPVIWSRESPFDSFRFFVFHAAAYEETRSWICDIWLKLNLLQSMKMITYHAYLWNQLLSLETLWCNAYSYIDMNLSFWHKYSALNELSFGEEAAMATPWTIYRILCIFLCWIRILFRDKYSTQKKPHSIVSIVCHDTHHH